MRSAIIDMREENKKYWKGLEELHEDPKFLEERAKEFPEELPFGFPFTKEESGLQTTRRDFLKLLGFSFGGAALAACTRMPVEKAIPYLIKPEEVVPGVANWYATTCAGCTASCGLLVKVRDGRPIKVEGNPESSLFQGGVCAVGQATVLSLYDDERLKGPLWNGNAVSWAEIDGSIEKQLSDIGSGKIVILSGTIVSPSTRALIGEWCAKFPNARHVMYDAVSSAAILSANEKSFGVRVLPHYRFDRAKVIVGLNADFLGTWISPVEFARAYAQNRKPGSGMSRHIQYESGMSLTGTNADQRFPINPSEEGPVALTLFQEISRLAGESLLPLPSMRESGGEGWGEGLRAVALDLWKHREESLVVSGSNDVNVQTIVNAINSLLGNIGKTIDLDNVSFQKQGSDEDLSRLVDEMNRGEIQGLILYGVNPAYDFPQAEHFVSGLKKIGFSLSFSDRLDETSRLVQAVCPEPHFLESWNDAEPVKGFLGLTQPVIRPLFNTRSAQDSLLTWMGRAETYEDYLRNFWEKNYSSQNVLLTFQSFWDRSVHDGVLSLPTQSPTERKFSGNIPTVFSKPSEGLEIHLHEKIGIRDGRHANNPWLQELPDPVTKITWDNYASLAPKTAASLGLEEGDVVSLESPSGVFEFPVQIQPGQAARTVSMAVGYGRTHCGKAGNKVGTNVYPLKIAASVTLKKTGRKVELAATQTHHSMEGRPIVQETSLEALIKKQTGDSQPEEKPITLWEEWSSEGHAWGMSIDLNACTGCSACIVSCQAENNVPVVGKDEVTRRREMHWIRLDRYYSGSEDNPETVHQPMMCQHCGNAPCETVCPVLATVHSTDGLNQQVYNRCVGTRYCANNCPYKVRRFNWFDYAHNDKFDYNMNSDLGTMVLNPDIVVRSRGVMEKCSMCVQRIQEGKLQAKREGRALKDGDIQVACQQSCPSQAITFGDLNDQESRVARHNRDGRFYHVLEELNVKPGVGYLMKVRN